MSLFAQVFASILGVVLLVLLALLVTRLVRRIAMGPGPIVLKLDPEQLRVLMAAIKSVT